MEDVHAKTKQIVRDILESDVNDDDDLFDFGLNSVNIIDIIVGIEDSFLIEFDEEHLSLEGLNSISRISEYVIKKIAGQTNG